MVWRIPCLATLLTICSQPLFDIYFVGRPSTHFGSHLVPFGSCLQPFWVNIGTTASREKQNNKKDTSVTSNRQQMENRTRQVETCDNGKEINMSVVEQKSRTLEK